MYNSVLNSDCGHFVHSDMVSIDQMNVSWLLFYVHYTTASSLLSRLTVMIGSSLNLCYRKRVALLMCIVKRNMVSAAQQPHGNGTQQAIVESWCNSSQKKALSSRQLPHTHPHSTFPCAVIVADICT